MFQTEETVTKVSKITIDKRKVNEKNVRKKKVPDFQKLEVSTWKTGGDEKETMRTGGNFPVARISLERTSVTLGVKGADPLLPIFLFEIHALMPRKV